MHFPQQSHGNKSHIRTAPQISRRGRGGGKVVQFARHLAPESLRYASHSNSLPRSYSQGISPLETIIPLIQHLATAFETLETSESGANSAADITGFTTTHADGLGGHLFSWTWLLGADAGGVHGLRGHHLDGLGLLGFLGRHCGYVCICLFVCLFD